MGIAQRPWVRSVLRRRGHCRREIADMLAAATACQRQRGVFNGVKRRDWRIQNLSTLRHPGILWRQRIDTVITMCWQCMANNLHRSGHAFERCSLVTRLPTRLFTRRRP